MASGKHIVPTERGLALFGILERADPALVDPGVTAQLECLLDEILVGRQDMMGAIDAVCAQAQRIIGRLIAGADAGDGACATALLGGKNGGGQVRPPTPAMRRYVDSLARQNGVTPPAGYAQSGAMCRAFLDQHSPKTGQTSPEMTAASPTRPQQAVAAGKRADEDPMAERRKAAVSDMPAGLSAIPVGTGEHQGKPRKRAPRMATNRTAEPDSRPRTAGKTKKASAATPPHPPPQEVSPGETSLRIPFGNKDAAQRFGAHYRAGGWYAPPGTDLRPFRERGWL